MARPARTFGEASAKEQVQKNPVTEPTTPKSKKTASSFIDSRMATVFLKMLEKNSCKMDPAMGTFSCKRAMKTYERTQPATTILVSVGVLFLITAITSAILYPLIFSAVLLLIAAWMFRSLTIEVSDTDLAWHFGSGWPGKRVPLTEVASVEPIRISFWNGWGIHYTPRGWLYNVSGYGAVAVTLRNGKKFCLGTDEPEELAAYLSRQ
jgi:hypothetical protein